MVLRVMPDCLNNFYNQFEMHVDAVTEIEYVVGSGPLVLSQPLTATYTNTWYDKCGDIQATLV